VPFELSPIVEPTAALAEQMVDGRLEGLVVKDRRAPYRDGSRAGWFKVKDRSWYQREAWRLQR
jgi:ATP-dependent DNA ligase